MYIRGMPHILPARDKAPVIHDSVWLAPNATVVGDVSLDASSTVWFSAVVRGDVARIDVGKRVNIQDGAVIHGTYEKSTTTLENDVSVGHNAVVHGAHVKQGALIGMGAVVMDHAVVGRGAVVAAGAVVLAGTQIQDGELWAGVPAKCRGQVGPDMQEHLSQTSARYVEYAQWFTEGSTDL
jgi:carbonic anhydrase/acetyltransferase-like protein (isoleucine patch superfamily)